MNAMALLCNLQADGPATLRRLRDIGCRTLSDLEAADVFELSEALASDPAFAERFVREARALAQRFGGELLEPEAGAPYPTPKRALAVPIAPRPADAPTERPAPARPAETQRASTTELAAALAAHVRHPSGLALRAGLIDGLDEAWCKALVGQGIRTLESLRDAPGLALARSLGRRLTELVGLQCLARRRLDDGSKAAALIERDDEQPYLIVPARRPLAEPDEVIFPTTRSNRPPFAGAESASARRDERDPAARVEQTTAPGTPTADGSFESGGPFA